MVLVPQPLHVTAEITSQVRIPGKDQILSVFSPAIVLEHSSDALWLRVIDFLFLRLQDVKMFSIFRYSFENIPSVILKNTGGKHSPILIKPQRITNHPQTVRKFAVDKRKIAEIPVENKER